MAKIDIRNCELPKLALFSNNPLDVFPFIERERAVKRKTGQLERGVIAGEQKERRELSLASRIRVRGGCVCHVEPIPRAVHKLSPCH